MLTEQLLPYRGEGLQGADSACWRNRISSRSAARRGPPHRLQIEAVWDDRPGGALRVFGLIEDGERLGAFAPITGEFTITSTGRDHCVRWWAVSGGKILMSTFEFDLR